MQNLKTLTISRPPRKTESVSILPLNDEGLLRCSTQKLLSLSLDEMRTIQSYFRSKRREPTDIELETIAQTWSEHCKHKTFRGMIEYSENGSHGSVRRVYLDLLKETIMQATRELDKSFCLSVFSDNAGVIAFDKYWGIAFKVETHNHPSALEPVGGAGTGIGGVIRDILGVGLGAKPFLNTDVFCVGSFGQRQLADSDQMPPERILPGVIAGVREYGNRMGIPTGNGAIWFHKGYRANPLVFCGTAGIIPRNCVYKEVYPGDLIVSIGGRTGRDGIHGATFSSLALEKGISGNVVQIGNAIVEKKVSDVILRARDKGLYSAITDCGAGGFSSAVGELGSICGADVSLENAPLKYQGLSAWEIWLSESQERMVLAIPKVKLKKFEEICEIEDVECSVIGTFSDNRQLTVSYNNEKICNLDMDFLHDGVPKVKRQAIWHVPDRIQENEVGFAVKDKDLGKILKSLLAHPNIGSKKWVVRQYDHEVQGGSVIKPFVGKNYDAPSDAAVYRPVLDSWKGVVVSNGINPLFGLVDPYWMAANVIDEALRNLVSVGGDVNHCALLDNFCWGNVNDPKVLGGLVRCSQACYDYSKTYGIPFISGKDSMNNTWRNASGKLSSIPSTLLISAIGVIEDVRKCVTMDFKKPGNWILQLGRTQDEFCGSHFNEVMRLSGGSLPQVDGKSSLELMRLIHCAIAEKLVRSCHDLSEGGLSVALAEMCMGGGLGARVDLTSVPGMDRIQSDKSKTCALFSESASRWIIEVEPQKLKKLKKIFSHVPYGIIGKVEKSSHLLFVSKDRKNSKGQEVLKLKVDELKKYWESFSNSQ